VSASPFFNFEVALRAARAGFLVRRNDWTTQWIQFYNGFFWLRAGTDTPRIVRAADLTREDMVAMDWTNLPPACISASLEQTGQTCPLPFTPVDVPVIPSVDPAVTPTVTSPPSGPNAITGPEGTTPPTGTTSGAGSGAGGSGSGGSGSGGSGTGTGGSGSNSGKRPRATVAWPAVTVTAGDVTDVVCYPGGFEGSQTISIAVGVSLGTSADTAAGKPAYGGYFVAVFLAGEMVWHGILWPGDSADCGTFDESGIPGSSSFTARARAHLPVSNCGDITSSASVTMKPWCDGSGDSGPVGGGNL
jgi:hypothetical protein